MVVSSTGSTPYGGHASRVFSVAYAPDGATLASGGAILASSRGDGAVWIWDARTGRQQHQLINLSWVRSVAYAPDGATLATGGGDGAVLIWDTRTGQQQHRLTGHAGWVYSVAYAPDGATLATGGGDGAVRIWDTRTGQQQHQLTGHARQVLSVAYAPDGATLATGSSDATVRIWDTRTGQQQHQLTGHARQVLSVAYAPDGATLATGSSDATVRIWDTRTGQQQHQLTGHARRVLSVAYAPDGATLASGGEDATVRIWDARTGQQQHQLTGSPEREPPGLGSLSRGRPSRETRGWERPAREGKRYEAWERLRRQAWPGVRRGARKHHKAQDASERQAVVPVQPPQSPPWDPVVYDDLVRSAFAELVQPGRLLFNPPARMQLGQTERIEVRLARTLELDAELLKHLRGTGEPQLEDIPTAPLMAVTLKSDAFQITAYSDEEQGVTQDGITTWEFDIRALKRGQQHLVLSVSLRIPVPGQPLEHKSIPVREATIYVQVGTPALVGQFVSRNWQWIIGTAIAIAAVVVVVLYH